MKKERHLKIVRQPSVTKKALQIYEALKFLHAESLRNNQETAALILSEAVHYYDHYIQGKTLPKVQCCDSLMCINLIERFIYADDETKRTFLKLINTSFQEE